ncbi:LysR family transcriptional regulator [Paenibacillus sp. CGMCC 1.16610]|uniref:LysR family transcriptional regulator n=2 Tax=Paenibacillus TaxID=44249 RepID=A0ABU6DMV4_9BACL|nr:MULTISPECIES: LysR family transcriptional regulator [Paenibacillus]MBA2939922.1 LysR family transcriptional regulator [Paenibacillus sp. CGMCC 1.16610]MCY9657257.1 LysR family transcriptional regulator [Paenibacillus anseongense]MEB4799114.1 LysR family transcriptional regulator [Paenibacillus chondroitinus]MVQ38877.1 LysR family transcriptional regulator [Paenibacillus anseongense]
MELRQLQYAIQIAIERNFSRAAEKLHIAQPSLSQQLSKLEKEIGVLLFQRSTNSVELTHAGSLFVEKSQKILDMVEQLKKEMEDISQMKKGRLVVGSMPITGSTILPFVVPAFQTAYPDIEISLVEETSANLETLTMNGQTDISLLSLPLREESLIYETLLEEEIVLAVPPRHPLTQAQEPISISQLEKEAFIALKKGQGFRKLTLDLCQNAGIVPNIVFESSNMETVQSLVAAGMGIAFVPYLISKRSFSELSPVHLTLEGRPTRTLVIAYRKGRYLSKAAEAFVSTMKEVMRTIG